MSLSRLVGERRHLRHRAGKSGRFEGESSEGESSYESPSKTAPANGRAEPDHRTFGACRLRRYAAPERSCPRIGSARSRLPVAAKIAFVTAGWIMVAPGSPTPPHFLPGVGVM
jgi:hypothetical protein